MTEIMAPAGNFESLAAALQAGAHSVYFGVGKLNMRAHAAHNFSVTDLPEIVRKCGDVKTYLTVNTVFYDEEIEEMKEVLDAAKNAGISAVIAHDIAVLQYAQKIGIPTHISTQANISNIEAVKFYSQFADVVVLARELRLDQIKKIIEDIKREKITGPSGNLVKVELFVHGALCVSISGKCYMSLQQYNASANRGSCYQACRRSYTVTDDETGEQLNINNKYVMSPKDLCMIRYLDKLLDIGVSVLKIEGRGRSPEYVHTVVSTYAEALAAISNNSYTEEKKNTLTEHLEKVFNRGFWHGGYYLGEENQMWAGIPGSKAKEIKKTVGVVLNYYSEKKIAEIEIQTNELEVGCELYIIGPTTGVVRTKIIEMRNDSGNIQKSKKGIVTIPIKEKIRKNDAVYRIFSSI